MNTRRWQIDPGGRSLPSLRNDPAVGEAAAMLRAGKLVAFPTETVYGLGADASDDLAVRSIFRAKDRPSDNPLIVHVAEESVLYDWIRKMPETGRRLASAFWPGPLTLVLEHRGTLASSVTAGLSTVGVRVPSHPVARALLFQAGVPVAAPSANRSGKPSPTSAEHVWGDLAGRIHGLLDGGPSGVGVESTVVDVTGPTPLLLRPGGITLDRLQQVTPTVEVDPGLQGGAVVPRSPGVKYRHYAPRGEMWVVAGSGEAQVKRVQALADEGTAAGYKVGILTTEERRKRYRADWVLPCGRRSDPASVARNLYRVLRCFDELGAEWIVAEGFEGKGLYDSVMNRLSKAADGRLIDTNTNLSP
ncbi:L-threonylcarbamoyladenylate synthase [Desmospora profundinema]|uniref:Threonylcarbamoyl-AMP synthase n=1 Tax=Desmospora profundinema TaxID=1571184 RepID=A0ABU1IL48_9BACL|nr:L-threonylcarbamoyladenylate synthase [Desmospora profundinema]MDR6225499.1 L-threonylcarbamoyladenylate synthase [Desmospora profundinema]